MTVPREGLLSNQGAIGRFFGLLVRERYSGFVDFDFAGKKRRLFLDDGRGLSMQSSAPGENLCDHLMTRAEISAEQRQNAIAQAKEKKAPLEIVLVAAGILPEARVRAAVAELGRRLIRSCLNEPTGSYVATEKAGLAAKLNATPIDLVPLLSGEEPQEEERPEHASPPSPTARGAGPKLPALHETLASLEGKSAYEILGLQNGASPDEIKKHYFELAKKWHTDRFSGMDLADGDKDALERLFGIISDAHKLLGDDQKRKDYDVYLDRKNRGLPTDMQDIAKAEAHFKLGEGLLRRGENQGALTELAEATRINPGEPEFLAAYGLAMYLARGSEALKDALAAIQRGLGMTEKLPAAHEYLGRIYRAEGDAHKAKNHFNKCLALDPKNIAAQRELRLMNMREESGKVAPIKPTGILGRWFKK